MAYLAGGMTFLYGSTMTLSCGYDISKHEAQNTKLKVGIQSSNSLAPSPGF